MKIGIDFNEIVIKKYSSVLQSFFDENKFLLSIRSPHDRNSLSIAVLIELISHLDARIKRLEEL